MSHWRDYQGFTLIELIVVIGIIAILTALAILAINPSRQFAQARNSQRQSDVRAIQSALDQESADTGVVSSQVTTTPVLIGTGYGALNLSGLVPNYVPAIPTDPKGGTSANTQYGVYKTAAGRLVVCATQAELSQTIGTGDCSVSFSELPSSLGDQLVAYWKLEEASGTRADSAGTNSLQAINTPGQAAGKVGNGVQLTTAQSQALGVASNSNLQFGTGSFSIALWAKWDSFPGNANLIGKNSGDNPDQAEWILRSAGNQVIFGIQQGGLLEGHSVYSGTTFSAGQWYFIVASYDATVGTITIQVNNGAINSATHTTGSNITSQPLLVGARGTIGSSYNYFDGTIDAVGLWKRVLTTQEKTDLYNSGNGLEHPF